MNDITSDLTSEVDSNIRLGIQGPPGSGKTWSALTFPNLVIANWDRALQAFANRTDIRQYKLYSPVWIKEKLGIIPDTHGARVYPNTHEVVKRLFTEHLIKLPPEVTLVWDSYTSFIDAFQLWNNATPWYGKDGKVNDYEAWAQLIDLQDAFHNGLKALNCNVVVTFHELQERDKQTGKLLDRVQPLVQGKFIAKIKAHYPFFFRQHAIHAKDPKTEKVIYSAETGKPLMEYLWQTGSDDSFLAKCVLNLPHLVPASYESFKLHHKELAGGS